MDRHFHLPSNQKFLGDAVECCWLFYRGR